MNAHTFATELMESIVAQEGSVIFRRDGDYYRTLRTIETAVGRFLPAQPQTLWSAQRAMITSAFRRHGGNVTRTARELGISPKTLRRKLDAIRMEG